jgi:Domain of unknown function (DUF5056)
MNPPENNDPLDALLREQNQYVADDGFTKRVISSLPRRHSRWSSQFFLLGAAIIGWIAAALWLLKDNLPPINASSLYSLDSQALWPWAIVLCVAASLTWAVVAAIQWED